MSFKADLKKFAYRKVQDDVWHVEKLLIRANMHTTSVLSKNTVEIRHSLKDTDAALDILKANNASAEDKIEFLRTIILSGYDSAIREVIESLKIHGLTGNSPELARSFVTKAPHRGAKW